MATFEKRGPYQYRAKVRRKGQKAITKTFDYLKDAQQWARQVESEMDRGAFISAEQAEKTPLQEVLQRYKDEVCPRLAKNGLDEFARLRRMKEAMGHLSLAVLQPSDVAKFRDERLRAGASPQTVRNELGLLNRVLKCCEIDWGIPLPRGIITERVRKPIVNNARDRRLVKDEGKRLLEAAHTSKSREIGSIVEIALETAARRAEIVQMTWEHIDLDVQTWHIPITKTGTPRTVPLTRRAVEILKGLPRQIDGRVWKMKREDGVTQAFARVCQTAEIDNLRFHDLRHEATSRFFERGLNLMEVAAITGHKDFKMLKRYTHLKAEDLVARLG